MVEAEEDGAVDAGAGEGAMGECAAGGEFAADRIIGKETWSDGLLVAEGQVVSIGPTIGWRALRNRTASTRQRGSGSLGRMITLDSLREFHRYGDEADRLVFAAAAKLSDEQLDRSMDLGMGSIRRICRHLLAGEYMYLVRRPAERA